MRTSARAAAEVPPFHEVVARRVRGRLAEERVTQVQLATRLDMSQQSVSRKLKGEQPFSLDELGVLAEFLGMTIGDLLGDGVTYPRHSDGRGTIKGTSTVPGFARPWVPRLLRPSDLVVWPAGLTPFTVSDYAVAAAA